MRTILKRLLPLLLAAGLLLSASLPVSAAKTITETVDITTTRNAVSGEGFYWSHRNKTMTFNSLRLETGDEYGFRFPAGATLILNGNSTIRASQYALTAMGDLHIKGSGTLTLISDHVGLRMDSPEYQRELIVIGGKVTFETKDIGIQSDYAAVTVGGGELVFKIGDRENGKAIKAHTLSLNSGNIQSNAPLVSDFTMELGGCAMEIDAAAAALQFTDIKVGSAATLHGGIGKNAPVIESYGGEKQLTVTAVLSRKTSVILGKNYAAAWDAVILTGCGILLAAAIGLPLWNVYRRNKKKRLEVEARRAEALAAKKAEAKQNRSR